MVLHPSFDQHLHSYHFKDFHPYYLPEMWHHTELKVADDPWWEFQHAVSDFNTHRSNIVDTQWWKVAYESMAAF